MLSPGRDPSPITEHLSDGVVTRDYALMLFVSGASDASAHAITDVRHICDVHLAGRYRLTIVDVNQQPDTSGQHHILATPTLVRTHPFPTRMVVGDMSDHMNVLLALDVPFGAPSGVPSGVPATTVAGATHKADR